FGSYYSINENITHSLQDRTLDNANLLSEIFEEKLKELKMIAEDENIQSMNWEVQKKELAIHLDTLEVKRFRIAALNGLSIATDGTIVNISDREFYQKAKQGIPNISGILKSKLDDSLVISCAAPIIKNKKVIGVLSYVFDYRMLGNLVKNIRVGKKGYAFLLCSNGSIIPNSQNDTSVLEKNVFEDIGDEFVNRAKKMKSGEIDSAYCKYNGDRRFITYSPVGSTEWVYCLSIPEKEIFETLDLLRYKFIVGSLLLNIIAIIVCCLFFRYNMQKEQVKAMQYSIAENHRQLAEAKEIDRLKTEFFANITHELRTPINVIFATLQLFKHSTTGKQDISDTEKRIKIMRQNCLRLIRLINNLIDATKIDASFLELNLTNGNIIRLIEDITQSVADYVKERGIDLTFDTDVEEKVMAFDPDKIERIMLNLLSNATKFTNDGGSIFVSIFDKADRIVISVKDTGIGIPEDNKNTIFERFRQVNKSLTRDFEGSGIGLSLVKSLVEMHGGNISVKSELGQGSEFIIELQVKVLPDEEEAACSNCYKSSQEYIEKINVEFSDIYF
ncbi:MAG TPA: sensor histidine kinase, partial [Clostridia bacterium]